jgi:hypothetical protein
VLEGMVGFATQRVRRVVVEQEKRVGGLGVRVPFNVVREGVVRPVLLQLQILGAADEIGTVSENVVPEGVR